MKKINIKKVSLQWKLTLLTTALITILCGCLTFFLYKNGVYYFDTLQESVTDQGTAPEAVYIDIPEDEWDDFVAQFSMKIYNSKSDYRSRSFLITVIVALFGGAATYFISGRDLETTQGIFRDSGKSSGAESDRLYYRRE